MEANEFRVVSRSLLTKREAEVLLWTAEGKTAWETARILGMTEGTCRAHLARVLDKLHAANKPHAVARGFAFGILARKLVLALIAASSFGGVHDNQAARVPRPPIHRQSQRVRSLALRNRGFEPRFIGDALLTLDQQRANSLEGARFGRQ